MYRHFFFCYTDTLFSQSCFHCNKFGYICNFCLQFSLVLNLMCSDCLKGNYNGILVWSNVHHVVVVYKGKGYVFSLIPCSCFLGKSRFFTSASLFRVSFSLHLGCLISSSALRTSADKILLISASRFLLL